jgi:predicted nucleotide-binding protein (sugar kinase/HSP70/actin superfamily)
MGEEVKVNPNVIHLAFDVIGVDDLQIWDTKHLTELEVCELIEVLGSPSTHKRVDRVIEFVNTHYSLVEMELAKEEKRERLNRLRQFSEDVSTDCQEALNAYREEIESEVKVLSFIPRRNKIRQIYVAMSGESNRAYHLIN